jgi:chemotaxis protein MotB
MARRHEHEEHANHEAWAIPYGDLITLLLAFFVVMYAVSSVNEGKYRVLSDSMMAAFRGSPKTTEPIQIGDKVVRAKTDESVAGLSPSQAMKLPAQRDDDQTGLVERFGLMGLEDGKQAEAAAAAPPPRDLAEQVQEALAPLIATNLVTVTRKPLWVEVEIKTDILFPSGSAEIESGAVEVLNGIADILRPLPHRLRIEGHTDNRPIATPQFPSNWELSGARAARIVRLLESRGVDPVRMSMAGQGEHQPVADNATADGRNRNRRVVLLILDRSASATPPATAAATPEAVP